LILAGVSQHVKEQLDRTEKTEELLGEEDIFVAVPTIGQSSKAAYQAAQKWLDQSKSE